jgi:hypothetical protein
VGCVGDLAGAAAGGEVGYIGTGSRVAWKLRGGGSPEWMGRSGSERGEERRR